MGKVFEIIDEQLRDFITSQHMFFVASAPLSPEGHVNLSPKGRDSLRVLDGRTVVYADFVGSGIETVAHAKENGRIVLMFCAMSGTPKIVRLHGRAEVVEPGHANFDLLGSQFPELSGLRCFIRVHCTRISDSCGWGVPIYEFRNHRSQLSDWAEQKGTSGLAKYQQEKNANSIDGLPGVTFSTGNGDR